MGKILSFNGYLERRIRDLFGSELYAKVIDDLSENPPEPVDFTARILGEDLALDQAHAKVLEALNGFASQLTVIHQTLPFWISRDLFLLQGLRGYLGNLATAFQKLEIQLEDERLKSKERLRQWE